MKTKSDSPIKLVKNVTNFSTWKAPSLDQGNAPSFRQPLEDEHDEEAKGEEELEQISAEELQVIRDAAYQEGFQSGRDAGLDSAKKQVDEQNELLSMLISQLNAPLQQCGEKTQQELLQLAFAIARQIVRRELKQDPTQLIAIIRESLKLLPAGSQDIQISLHPEDASIVGEALSITLENPSDGWLLKSDPSVARGSCKVITENSKVDASIDKQIAVLFSRMAGGQRAGESDLDE